MITLSPLVLDLVKLGVAVAPTLIAAAETEIALVNAGAAPSAEQQAALAAALDAAHAALQAAQQGQPGAGQPGTAGASGAA